MKLKSLLDRLLSITKNRKKKSEKVMDENEKKDLNDIEYYANSVNAWFATKLEGTKSILTISAGGLGLLLTLLTVYGANNITELILYFGATLCFMIAIILMITVFYRNARLLEKLNSGEDEKDNILNVFNFSGICFFAIGIMLSFLISSSILINELNNFKEERMTGKEKTVEIRKSYNNAQSMKPQNKPTNNTSKPNRSSQNNNPPKGKK